MMDAQVQSCRSKQPPLQVTLGAQRKAEASSASFKTAAKIRFYVAVVGKSM